jgi:UDP-N-acetylglucosamine--N-acetylmuramyl-(pentapeptide) pyrophosphoryl-undecaprenol N-acetylglucosamine transferase
VYPALSVLAKLPRESVELLWVGGEGGMEVDLVQREGIPYRSVPAAGVHGVGLRTLPKNLVKLARGVLASRKILREFKPDALFFTGGYVAVPMAVAGWNIPNVLYVPDIEPGLALKALAWFADKITVSTPTSSDYFSRPERIVPTGYPLRPDLANWQKEAACKELGLNVDEPVLLVFGGSKGARSINNAVLAHLPKLLAKTQVVHITGKLDHETVQNARNALGQNQAERYRVFGYLHEMGIALGAADLVISRAGASSLGEYPFFGLPAILVPYPYAWRYQKVNAEYLSERGAAELIKDEDLDAQIVSLVDDLLQNAQKLNEMRTAMKALAEPYAAEKIAAELLAVAEKR